MFLALFSVACEREARVTGSSLPESTPSADTTDVRAGATAPLSPDPRAREYEGNAYHVGEGARHYEEFNCITCHAHGGGDIGPALIDTNWAYGGSIEQIVATITQGRPNGMPSFRNLMTPTQIWETAAYVRALAGQLARDVPPSRSDTMSNGEPLTLKPGQPAMNSDGIDPQGLK
jgi:cytochrome c oxidase cbb3-type subunit 3